MLHSRPKRPKGARDGKRHRKSCEEGSQQGAVAFGPERHPGHGENNG